MLLLQSTCFCIEGKVVTFCCHIRSRVDACGGSPGDLASVTEFPAANEMRREASVYLNAESQQSLYQAWQHNSDQEFTQRAHKHCQILEAG